jgi:hypothetical protein
MTLIREITYWSKRFYKWILGLGELIDRAGKIIHLIGVCLLSGSLFWHYLSFKSMAKKIETVTHQKDSCKKKADSCIVERINSKY